MVKLDRFTRQQTDALKEAVDAKILEQANRIQQATETFKDALMLSNKTYFLEEVTKHKQEKKALKRELAVLKDKERLTDDLLVKRDQRIDELLQANAMLEGNLAHGSKEMEKMFQQNTALITTAIKDRAAITITKKMSEVNAKKLITSKNAS